MKIAAGIIALIFGMSSLGYVGIFGGSLGIASSWLGSQFGSTGMQNWGNTVQLLCWAAPLLAIVGGALAFSSPGFACLLLGGSAACHWALLGTSSYGNMFGGAMAVSAALAFIGALAEPTKERAGAASNVSSAEPRDSFDRARWNALLEYDSDIARAAEQVRRLGEAWVDELASSYLALNDKSYLPGIVEKIALRAEQQRHQYEQRIARQRERDDSLRQEKERRAQAIREKITRLRDATWGTRNRRIAALTSLGICVAIVGMILLWPKPPVFAPESRLSYTPWTSTCYAATNSCYAERDVFDSAGKLVAGIIVNRFFYDSPSLASTSLRASITVNTGRSFRDVTLDRLTLDGPAGATMTAFSCSVCTADRCGQGCVWHPTEEFMEQMKAAQFATVHAVNSAGREGSLTIPMTGFGLAQAKWAPQ